MAEAHTPGDMQGEAAKAQEDARREIAELMAKAKEDMDKEKAGETVDLEAGTEAESTAESPADDGETAETREATSGTSISWMCPVSI